MYIFQAFDGLTYDSKLPILKLQLDVKLRNVAQVMIPWSYQQNYFQNSNHLPVALLTSGSYVESSSPLTSSEPEIMRQEYKILG